MLSLVANTYLTAKPQPGITVHDPRDGAVVGSLQTATDDEIAIALGWARATAADWAARSPEERARALEHMAAALETNAHELAGLNSLETGRRLDESLAAVSVGAGVLRRYAELGPLHRSSRPVGARPLTETDYTLSEPRGVVVALTPWSDPVAITVNLLGAAIVAGNVVVHKPSEHCPHLGTLLGEVLGAELPDGVLTTLVGGPDVGSVLAASSGVDVIAHIGSTATGRRVSAWAARTGAHVIRGNSGNDALLIDADVDPRWAAQQAAEGTFSNSGQSFTAVERIFVHRAIADQFLEALVQEADQRNQGHELAPLITPDARFDVHEQVLSTVDAGGIILAGGRLPPGSGTYYPATVVADCPVDSPLMTEETFGPVAPVHTVDDFETGLILAAIDRYGLAATVLSGSLAHIEDAIATLPVGQVKINSVRGSSTNAPSQPRGDSGMGFGHGIGLLDEMTIQKVVHVALPVLRVGRA